MRSMIGDVLLQNNRVIQRYFQGSKWPSDLDALTFAAAKAHHSSGTPLDKLVMSEMIRKEAAREKVLEKLFYNIDAPESLDLVVESSRFEAVSNFFCPEWTTKSKGSLSGYPSDRVSDTPPPLCTHLLVEIANTG